MTPAAEIVSGVRRVIGGGSRKLQAPPVGQEDAAATVDAAFDQAAGRRSVADFEAALVRITGARHAVAVASGTAALQLALIAAGVKPGDEVLCPALTFAATAFAICHCGAVPHFVDVRQSDLGIAPFKLRQYLGNMDRSRRSRIKAIVPVHLLGICCSIIELSEITGHYGIALIEDAAEALGTLSTGFHCGTMGHAGILSFNLNKIVTTLGGGAVLTNDDEIMSAVRHLSTNAKVPHAFRWDHDAVGFNYRINPLGAAFGLGQLRRLDRTLAAKRTLGAKYAAEFAIGCATAIPGQDGSNCWLNAIALDPRLVNARDEVLMALIADGFEARALFTPLHMLPMFKGCPRQPSLECAEDLFRRTICLPSTVAISG